MNSSRFSIQHIFQSCRFSIGPIGFTDQTGRQNEDLF